LKGLVSTPAMARMSVAEAVTNMMGCRVTALTDAKCSANWMWAAKLPCEGAAMYDACDAMAAFMIAVGVAVDGGKDSLSMAAKAPDGEMVKAPGTLVISLYCPCPDVRRKITPDIKAAGASALVAIHLGVKAPAATAAAAGAAGDAISSPPYRLGGSALAQCFGQVGGAGEVPDCDDPAALAAGFATVQSMLDEDGLLLAGHDRSDGGTLVAALEMAFAGNCGLDLNIPAGDGVTPLAALFAEEAGYLVEVAHGNVDVVLARLAAAGLDARRIGFTTASPVVTVSVNGVRVLTSSTPALRDVWEATGFELERLQCDPACVASEQATLAKRRAPPFHLTFTPAATPAAALAREPTARPRVAILREEGTNGDREMGAAFFAAGFDVWDVTMSDLLAGRAAINSAFRGLVFPGGFSYADVLDSAKGWAGVIRYHPALLAQFTAFYRRSDTFSLGVCNGCQLSALLGWVPFGPLGAVDGVAVTETTQPRFVHNASGRFESRFSTVRITDSPAIMFKGMAGSVLGVWVAHGEGRAHFADPAVLAKVMESGMVPLQYVDDDGAPTEVYPFNPNGSPHGIAGLVTPDGRHLAVMPHPERVHTLWQWPWMPTAWSGRDGLPVSPWMRMFQNAREWCEATATGAGC